MGERDDRMIFGRKAFGRVKIDPAVLGQRDDVDGIAGELPRDDIAMMFERGQEDTGAPFARMASSDEIDGFGRAAGEDQLAFIAADQTGRGGACGLEALGHRRRTFVDAAVHGGVIAAIGSHDGVDNRLRLLRGGGAVEIVPVADPGKLVADAERGIDAGLDVHAIALNAALAWAAISLPSPSASHRPPTNPSSSSARALAGSRPRAAA